jgi:putative flavoprotein involved in K+ transport
MGTRSTTAVIIGGGQAGLAMSRCLTDRGVDHVVLERGRVAERWRSERWSSLRLLTPNWQTRLPGWRYGGDEPDGFMAMPEVVAFLDGYAASFDAPVHEHTTVRALERRGDAFVVMTDEGTWQASNVIIATGACDTPKVPPVAAGMHRSVHQTTPAAYRDPGGLPEGGVLVVGAGASGVQLALELHRSGREVVLSVGSHSVLPRRYRGLDIQWWLDRTGILDRRAEDVADLDAARREPSLQLAGDRTGASLGLDRLQRAGVRLAGRLTGVRSRRVTFADDLAASCAAAHERQRRVLDRIDNHIVATGLAGEVDDPVRPAPVQVERPVLDVDLRRAGVSTVLWATGYQRRYPWLHIPVLDAAGEIRHHGGMTPVPGLYVIGLPFLRRRKSTFIDGVGPDAEELTDHLVARLHGRVVTTARSHP